jgi:mono/diheme cytochrome c family protein
VSRPARAAAVLGLATALAFLLPAASGGAPKKKASKTKPAATDFDPKLPVLGTRLAEFPPGEGKAIADSACLACHSTDMVRQQRLNEKQWAAAVTKMVGWGADVPENQREALISYLVKNFGPDNDRFQLVVTRPVGK